jgi:hypothetical protein
MLLLAAACMWHMRHVVTQLLLLLFTLLNCLPRCYAQMALRQQSLMWTFASHPS